MNYEGSPTDYDAIRQYEAGYRDGHRKGYSTGINGAVSMKRLVRVAVDRWPEFDCDYDVNGGDMVEWFAEWRARAKELLGEEASAP